MLLPVLKDFDFKEKRVLVRGDLDVVVDRGKVVDEARLRECLPTIQYLLEHGVKEIVLLGHLGRPDGRVVKELSLLPVAEKLKDLLDFQFSIFNFQLGGFSAYQISTNISLLENLRFDPREEKNDQEFAKKLANLGNFYVNEAFAASHRRHASIVGVPKFLPHSAGLHFAEEVENLSKVLGFPKRPLVFIIGGAKPETKLPMVADFAKMADWVLIGGLLTQNSNLKTQIQNLKLKNIIFTGLTGDEYDISKDSIKKLEEIIRTAGTVVWNGPLGRIEDEKWEAGTRKIAEVIANSTVFKIVGGGDTIAALKKFRLLDKMDYVSTGGGAMLEFLAKGTLPGINALIEQVN